MEFSIGNIVTLLIVVIILAIYRQLDRNNRSLEKIKRYSDKIKDELDAYIETKTVEVKNYAIELDVHQETGKAIINRIKAAEDQLENKAAYIEKMYDRINEYDKALDDLTDMTGRVQQNLERLHEESEFVDKVGKRVKEAGINIAKLEKEIPSLREEFARENLKELKTLRGAVLKDTQKIMSGIEEELKESESRITAFRTSVSELENTRELMEKETRASIQQIMDEQIYRTEQTGEKLAEDLGSRFETMLSRKSDEAEAVENGLSSAFDKIAERYSALSADFENMIDQFRVKAKSTEAEYINSMNAAAEKGLALEGEIFEALEKRIQKDRSDIENSLSAHVKELTASARKELDDLRSSFSSEAEASRAELMKIAGELRESGDTVREQMSATESRVSEYEDALNYKFSKMEAVSSDIDSLENNLRQSMEQSVSRIESDFRDYEKQLDQKLMDYKQKISDEMTELNDGLNSLEVELDGLKNRAYENVSEGLKVFEDDFFSDLKTRNAAMEEKLLNWQRQIDENLSALAGAGEEARGKVEKEYTEKLRQRLEELQGRIFANQEKFEAQVAGFQSRVEERMGQADSSVVSAEESIRKELQDIQESANASFSREFAEFNAGISAQLKKTDREIENRLKEMDESVDLKGKELIGFVENVKSDVTVWQAKILQEMKEARTDMTTGYDDLKNEVNSNISQIKAEFDSQREDLILNTQEERARIKNEIKENADAIMQLETDLHKKTESAIENFNREYETFVLEIQKRNREMQLELDKRIKDFRQIAVETRDKTEQLQKKLYGKIEENYKILAVNLQEIDKRQKGFISQTKIFDRADSLKVSLQEGIEDLKAELAKVEAQSSEVRETERKFATIKKLGDEVNTKLGRFLAEKRRIEEMEGDFKKLINISQAVDTKLNQVTNSHDDLQAIQIRIKNLEELEKEVSLKYDRLEKKDQIIENTTSNVDRNFQQLGELDDQIRILRESIAHIPDQIHEMSARIETLSRNKKKADETLKQVEELENMLKDVETRTDNMQKAREWLAKTETRLEEVSKQAQEQVKLLGTILKEGNKSGGGGKGAPSMGAREVVTRLAHQGWSVQEIASTTKLSRGEVELILELIPRK